MKRVFFYVNETDFLLRKYCETLMKSQKSNCEEYQITYGGKNHDRTPPSAYQLL